jgi:prophage regulatory protein
MPKPPSPFGSTPLVDAEQIAAFLGCSVKHVRRLADLGQFPKPVKVGRLRRWCRQAVELWVEQQQQQQQQGGSNDAN